MRFQGRPCWVKPPTGEHIHVLYASQCSQNFPPASNSPQNWSDPAHQHKKFRSQTGRANSSCAHACKSIPCSMGKHCHKLPIPYAPNLSNLAHTCPSTCMPTASRCPAVQGLGFIHCAFIIHSTSYECGNRRVCRGHKKQRKKGLLEHHHHHHHH